MKPKLKAATERQDSVPKIEYQDINRLIENVYTYRFGGRICSRRARNDGKKANIHGGVVLKLVVVVCVLEKIGAVWLNLPSSGTKCVSEEIHNNVFVLADYVVISDDHVYPTPSMSAKVCVGVLGPWVSDLCAPSGELNLSKELEGVVEAIHENLVYLKSRESETRIVSEKTNARVAWFSIMSLGVCILASVSQILYLKRYFQKKKLI